MNNLYFSFLLFRGGGVFPALSGCLIFQDWRNQPQFYLSDFRITDSNEHNFQLKGMLA